MIKSVVTAHYVHKSNIQELVDKKIPSDKKADFLYFMEIVKDNNIPYDIIKYDKGNVTLITSPDWDEANEPIVGICRRWKDGEWFTEDGLCNPKETSNFRQIYHNKWQFVADDYSGFDIGKAKERTKLWNSIPNLDKKRIGNKNYWVQLLQENGMKV